MRTSKYDIRAYKSGPWIDMIELHIFDKQNRSIATNIEFQVAEEGRIYDPALHLDYMSAQILMDSLWDCGIRPSEGAGSAGAMKATQDHLKDMRKLVSHLMKTDL